MTITQKGECYPSKQGEIVKNTLLKSLTPRQFEVGRLAGKKLTNKQISKALNIGIDTVKNHVAEARRRLGKVTRDDLAKFQWDDFQNNGNNIVDISGLWLSKFEYTAHRAGIDKKIEGVQYDIEYIDWDKEDAFFYYEGENIFCCGNPNIKFYHDLKLQIQRDNVIGICLSFRKITL